MSDTSTETEPQETADQEQKPAEKTFTQSEVDQIVGRRLARAKEEYGDYDDLKAAAAELQKIKDAGKSEQQKLNDQIATLQKQLADKDAEVEKATLAAIKSDVARVKGVPANRLHGKSKEELEADADAYLAEVGQRETAKPRKPAPTSGLKSGASSSGETSSNPREAAAMALRRMRNGA